jgi:hypothetical protein
VEGCCFDAATGEYRFMGYRRHDRAQLSIPSFASERCRAMTTELIRTLEAIAPMDDQALEDRALACFVVACGELALMKNTAHRDTVVGQLTVVGSKLVKEAAATVDGTHDQPIDAAKDATKERPVNAAKAVAEDRRTEAAEPVTEKRQTGQAEVTPQMGMTWDQLEAVLKREKADRETSVRLSQSFP